jgi:PadR family transcriptional regulator PadR
LSELREVSDVPVDDGIEGNSQKRSQERVLEGDLLHTGDAMSQDKDLFQGTLALMILKTLEARGKLHGYGIARRIEQISGNQLIVQYGTLHPALLRLERGGYIVSMWGVSENNRKARFYKLTGAGLKQVENELQRWEKASMILARFLCPGREAM